MAENRSSSLDAQSNRNAAARETIQELHTKTDLTKKEIQKINEYSRELDRDLVKSKYQLMKELEDAAHKDKVEKLKSEGKVVKATYEEAFGTAEKKLGFITKSLSSGASALTSQIDASLTKYLNAQQSLAAHLSGSNTSLSSVLNSLQNTLSTSNIVRQERVFDNLGNLVKSGITYNVEQRAFLQTLAQDIDMVFNAQDGSLTQLIRLQNRDLSSNRMAIEYSLQKFLNQNYQTSEYIKHFADISGSLLTAQSTMNARQAVDFEGTIQTWLGSMYSAGMNSNTVSSLASALNALGSGDISNLGSGISNLVLMGAARAGLDYGALLNNGLDANTTDKLLASITSYMQEMGANQSNVVRSQLGNLFGVNITDIIAANNMRPTQGSVSSDIGTLLGDYGNFITFGTGLQNRLANMMWSFGTNVATNQSTLMAYEISKIISSSGLGQIIQDLGENMIGSGAKISGFLTSVAGIALSNAQLIPVIASMFGPGGSISDIVSSSQLSGAAAIFDALGKGSMRGGDIRISDAGVSGSMYISNGGLKDILAGSQSSLNELTSSVTTVEADQGPTLEENVTTITDTVTAIFDLLTKRLESIDDNVFALSATNNLASAAVTGWSAVNRGASF